MSDIKDFEFNSSGWDNNRWDLHYIGDDRYGKIELCRIKNRTKI